jgi:hypothetical protein
VSIKRTQDEVQGPKVAEEEEEEANRYKVLRYVCACMVDFMHVHESMQLMIHGVELLDIGSTGYYEEQNEGNTVVLGS